MGLFSFLQRNASTHPYAGSLSADRRRRIENFKAFVASAAPNPAVLEDWNPIWKTLLHPEAPIRPIDSPFAMSGALSKLFELLNPIDSWSAYDDFLLDYFYANLTSSPPSISENFSAAHLTHNWGYHARNLQSRKFTAVVQVLKRFGMSEEEVWEKFVIFYAYHDEQPERRAVEPAAAYLLEHASENLARLTKLLSSAGEEVQKQYVDVRRCSHGLLRLLLRHRVELVRTYFDFLTHIRYDNGQARLHSLIVPALLLSADRKQFYNPVESLLRLKLEPEEQFSIQLALFSYVPERTAEFILDETLHYLEFASRYGHVDRTLFLAALNILNAKGSAEQEKTFFEAYFASAPYIRSEEIAHVLERMGGDAMPLLESALNRNFDIGDWSQHTHHLIFETLTNPNYHFLIPDLWALLARSNGYVQRLVIEHLLKIQGQDALENAKQLLNSPDAEARVAGAYILSRLESPESQQLLQRAVKIEKNDDARDRYLAFRPQGHTEILDANTVAGLVQEAKIRGKLKRPVATWLSEADLPTLHWADSSLPFDAETTRWLLYRASRSEGLSLDPEAQATLPLIDRTSSPAFAAELLRRFLQKGAKSSYIHCLTIVGALGGPELVSELKKILMEWAKGRKSKACEFILQALLMNRTDAALRVLEELSRTLRKRRPALAELAGMAFATVAEQTRCTPIQLADRLVPDFGFENLFFEFDVRGERFRAFVDSTFTLVFLDESNQQHRTMPRRTCSETRAFLKQVAQEIKPLVKLLTVRLEADMIVQRVWDGLEWEEFFLRKPVPFAFATTLIWGVLDEDEKDRLSGTFYCQEDQTLLDETDQEFTLQPDARIVLVHPARISESLRETWNEKIRETASLQPVFRQLDRPVVRFANPDRYVLFSEEFSGAEFPSGRCTTYFEKLGWERGPVDEYGSIWYFFKDFSRIGLVATITVNGLYRYFTEENQLLRRLVFARTDGKNPALVVLPEYDHQLIPFDAVPPTVYSEVLADLQSVYARRLNQ